MEFMVICNGSDLNFSFSDDVYEEIWDDVCYGYYQVFYVCNVSE